MEVAAIIVGSDDSQISLTRTALSRQTVSAGQTLIYANLIEVRKSIYQMPDHVWFWFLEDGMEPHPNALSQLLEAAEASPSAGWLAPKLVRKQQSKMLVEFGLTLSPLWYPISLASGQLDQAQHDGRQDMLAASILGSLIQADPLKTAWPILPSKRNLTLDYQLAVKMRLSGYRVLAAPAVRIEAADEATDFSKASWLQKRKTQIDLVSGYHNLALGIGLAVAAPVLGVLQVFWLMLLKRPERIWTNLVAGFWWLFATPMLIVRRPRLSREERSGIGKLKSLFASKEDRQRAAQSGFDLPVALAESQQNQQPSSARFTGVAGPWIMLALAALSWRYWPSDLAVSGGSMLPLGDSLQHLFSRAGASWQNLGLGVAAPSDPFNWVLFAMGLVTFWAPSFGPTLFLFLIKPLAFGAAWRLLSLASSRGWAVTIGALAYAFWPAIDAVQSQGRLGDGVAFVLLPLFLFSLSRILDFGAASRRSVQTWTWVGSGALLAAAISASAPSLAPYLAVMILLLAIYRFKRIGYLMWLPVPLLVIWLPYAWYLVAGLAHPLLVLSQPGSPQENPTLTVLQAILGGSNQGHLPGLPFSLTLVSVGCLLAIAAGGLFGVRSLNVMWFWLVSLAAVASAFAFNRVHFVVAELGYSGESLAPQPGDPYPLLGVAGLITSVTLVLALANARKTLAVSGATLAVISILILAADFLVTPTSLSWSNGRTMPALVVAQAQVDSQTRTLVIESRVGDNANSRYDLTLVTGAGHTLEDGSSAFQAGRSSRLAADPRYRELTALGGNLLAATGTGLDSGLKKFGISYVLVAHPERDYAVASQLDTEAQLEPVGTTEFGRLWRVKGSEIRERKPTWDWSVTKQIQVGFLLAFGLLAIPTRRRNRVTDSSDGQFDSFDADSDGGAF